MTWVRSYEWICDKVDLKLPTRHFQVDVHHISTFETQLSGCCTMVPRLGQYPVASPWAWGHYQVSTKDPTVFLNTRIALLRVLLSSVGIGPYECLLFFHIFRVHRISSIYFKENSLVSILPSNQYASPADQVHELHVTGSHSTSHRGREASFWSR